MSQFRVRSFLWIALPALLLCATAAALFFQPGMEPFMPHAHCYLFHRGLMLLHGCSDFFIGLSYVSISATLTYLVFRARRELPFHWMMEQLDAQSWVRAVLPRM